MNTVEQRVMDVPVDGGTMHVGVWGSDAPDAPVVLAVHGITASHLAWDPAAQQLPEVRFVAPDLRGRGRSAELPGPWGMVRHGDDLARVLDVLDVPEAVVVGHSMGGFVSLVLRHRHPERVRGLLLVDGGLPLRVPPAMTVEQVIEAILGPALARLSMTFPDRAAYQQFWRSHPAFSADWGPAVAAYVDYDLTGTEPELVSRVRPEAVREDSVDQLEGSALRDAVAALGSRPVSFLRAPRGLQNEPPGLYPEPLMTSYEERIPGLRWRTVPDVNHYTILLSERGTRVVASEVRALLGGDR